MITVDIDIPKPDIKLVEDELGSKVFKTIGIIAIVVMLGLVILAVTMEMCCQSHNVKMLSEGQ